MTSSLIVNESHATLSVGSNAHFLITGSDDLVTVGASSTVSVTGSADAVQLSGAGDALTLGGDGQYASDAGEDTAIFAAGGVVDLLASSRVDVSGDDVTAQLAANDTFGLYGSGEIVNSSSAGDAIWIGDDGMRASGAAIDAVNLAAGGFVFELSNSNVDVAGSHVSIKANTNDTLSVNGGADSVTVLGAGDVLYIGGNGVGASDADDNFVVFRHGGTLYETASSRTDVKGSGVAVNMSASDTLGLYGSGDVVDASAASDSIWIGQNGQSASGASLDQVNFAAGGYVFELAGTNLAISGNGVAATVTSDDTLTATGSALTITALSAGDIIDIGGDGPSASNADDNFVYFDDAGALNEMANARVDAYGDDVVAYLASNDTFGIYGRDDVVNAQGAGDAVWIGVLPNEPIGADFVNFQSGGKLTVLTGSAVDVTGSNVVVRLEGADQLTATGSGYAINATAGGYNAVTIGGDGVGASGANIDNVKLAVGDVMTVEKNSVVAATGDGWNAYLNSDDALTAKGLAITLDLGFNDAVTMGGNGEDAYIADADTLSYYSLAGFSVAAAVDLVELASSTVDASLISGLVTLDGQDSTSLVGHSIDVVSLAGGSQIQLTGDQLNFYDTTGAYLDTVTLRADDTLSLVDAEANVSKASGGAGTEEVLLDLAARATLSGTGYALEIGGGAGVCSVGGFNAGDTLDISATFVNSAALLAATTFANGSTTIQLDATVGDTLTLTNYSQSQMTAALAAGTITFHA